MKIAEVHYTSSDEAEIVFTTDFVQIDSTAQMDLIKDMISDLQSVYDEMGFDKSFIDVIHEMIEEERNKQNFKLQKEFFADGF